MSEMSPDLDSVVEVVVQLAIGYPARFTLGRWGRDDPVWRTITRHNPCIPYLVDIATLV